LAGIRFSARAGSFSLCQDQLWVSSRLLSSEYRGFSPEVKQWGMKLTTFLYIIVDEPVKLKAKFGSAVSQKKYMKMEVRILCSRVRFPAGAGNFSLHQRVQNGSGAHPASYPMDTRCSFPGGKAAGV
jgi:hypothetical protein